MSPPAWGPIRGGKALGRVTLSLSLPILERILNVTRPLRPLVRFSPLPPDRYELLLASCTDAAIPAEPTTGCSPPL